MPKSLPVGMCNVSIFMSDEERSILGRTAFAEDRSIGSLLRHLVVKALETERPDAAAQIVAARARRKAVAHVAMLAGLVALLVQSFSGEHDFRRPSRAKVARAVKVKNREVEL